MRNGMIKRGISTCFAFLFLIAIYANQSSAALPATEYNALVALYNATGGSTTWTNTSYWLGPGSPCSAAAPWYGVTCDVTGSHVVGLNLFQNGLSGTLPNELASLTELTDLDLSHNNLSGIIPLYFANFSKLKTLFLNSNNFTGTIPSGLGLLSQLTNLELYGNQLTGKIPKKLGELTNLVGLALSTNRLSGRIPDELGLLTSLTYLYLEDNQLCGEVPLSFLNLIHLTDNNGLSIKTNQLYTNNSALDAFLTQKNGDWKTSQEPRYCSTWPMFLPAVTKGSRK